MPTPLSTKTPSRRRSDVAHLLQGLGKNGLTKLFHNLSILAWGERDGSAAHLNVDVQGGAKQASGLKVQRRTW